MFIESPSSDSKLRKIFCEFKVSTVDFEDEPNLTFVPEVRDVPFSILRDAIAGDVEAFGNIYEIYNDGVLHYCRIKVPFDEAEDCAQQTWERVFRKVPNFEFIGIPFRHYLFSAAKHICIDWWRRFRGEDPLPDADYDFFKRVQRPFDQPDAIVELRDTLERTQNIVDSLTDGQREVVVLRLNGMAYSEIAEVTGKREVTLRQTALRGFSNLREALTSEGLL